MTREEIINEINKAKEEQGVSMYRLALDCGVSHPTIARVLGGENAYIDVIISMCEALDLSITVKKKEKDVLE